MSNILSHITYVFDRYKKASSRKEGVVEMRISYNYKQKYIRDHLQKCVDYA